MDNLCIEYSGKKYFVGEIARRQSQPRVTMGAERFTGVEGMGLMCTVLALLAEEDHEHIRLVAGLPVSDFQRVKEKYRQALLGPHSIRLLQTDGNWGVDYSVTINEVRIIPQPVGTLFWAVLGEDGSLINKAYAAGKMAVLDIGQLYLARTYEGI